MGDRLRRRPSSEMAFPAISLPWPLNQTDTRSGPHKPMPWAGKDVDPEYEELGILVNEDIVRLEQDVIPVVLRIEGAGDMMTLVDLGKKLPMRDAVLDAAPSSDKDLVVFQRFDGGIAEYKLLYDGITPSEALRGCRIYQGATFVVRQRHQDDANFETAVADLLAINPHLDRDEVYDQAVFEDGATSRIMTWDLAGRGITALPDSFCNLRFFGWGIGDGIMLEDNKLETLPEHFSNLQGVNWLDLSNNRLKSLPDSFGLIRLGNGDTVSKEDAQKGSLDLCRNALQSLPESFGTFAKSGASLKLDSEMEKSLNQGCCVM